MKKYFLVFLAFYSFSIIAQETNLYVNPQVQYENANSFFEEGSYAAAKRAYQNILNITDQNEFQTNFDLKAKAELGMIRSAIRLEFVDAPILLKDAIDKYYPFSYAYPAVLDLANYHFKNKDYKKAIGYYKMIENKQLSTSEEQELFFKLGYCYFVQKKFTFSKPYFNKGLNLSNKYYKSNIYYSGMVAYFNDDFDTAITLFKKVEHEKRYQSHIPYYLCQIYFAKKQYSELIPYAKKQLQKRNPTHEKGIKLLLGQTYFIQKEYKLALPYLEYYESNTIKLSEDEFYQIGYTQYVLEQYDNAITNLSELTMLDSKMGVLSNYYLADAYMKTGDKVSARTAFKKVSTMSSANEIKDEARYNYAKLSAELGFEREAILNLLSFSNHDSYGNEAQSIVSKLLLNSTDYMNAIKTINGITNQTNEIKNTLAKLIYYQGLKFYNDKSYNDAEKMFSQVLIKSSELNYTLQAQYYLSLISHKNGKCEESIDKLNNYFDHYDSKTILPDEVSITFANYLQAHNYLCIANYETALNHFVNALNTVIKLKHNDLHDKLYAELVIRSADCAFKIQKRDLADQYYQVIMNEELDQQVYATYQLAMIRGLDKKPYEKIVLLEKITTNFPSDELADDALMELGNSYLSLTQYNKAFTQYKSIVQKHKKSAFRNQALLKLGLISYNQGDVQDALTFYKEIFVYNPTPKESQQALISIREIYVEDLGQADKYVEFSENIAGFKISDFAKDSLYFEIAYTQYKNGKYKQSIEKFDNYIIKYEKGFYIIPAYYYRAESQTLSKSYSKALNDYKFVINAGLGDYFNKSIHKAALISYNHEENYEDALRFYKQMNRNSNTPKLIYTAQLGALQSAFHSNNLTETKQFATLVIQNKLGSNDEKTAAFFFSGKLFYDTDNYNQAIPSLNQVIKLNTNEHAAQAKYLLAKIYYNTKQLDKAQKQCLDINNTNSYSYWVAKSLILLSDVLVEKLDFFNAKAALEAVLEHYKEDLNLTEEAVEKLKIVNQKETHKSRLKIIDPEKLELED